MTTRRRILGIIGMIRVSTICTGNLIMRGRGMKYISEHGQSQDHDQGEDLSEYL